MIGPVTGVISWVVFLGLVGWLRHQRERAQQRERDRLQRLLDEKRAENAKLDRLLRDAIDELLVHRSLRAVEARRARGWIGADGLVDLDRIRELDREEAAWRAKLDQVALGAHVEEMLDYVLQRHSDGLVGFADVVALAKQRAVLDKGDRLAAELAEGQDDPA